MKIVCYGDSNTYGWDPRDFFGNPYEKPWPTLVADFTSSAVINLGEPGRMVPHSPAELHWFLSMLSSQAPIDLLIIMLGTNDLLLPSPNVADIACRMEKFLSLILSHYPLQKILLLIPPTPQADFSGNINSRQILYQISHDLSVEYQKLAKKFGIVCLDSNHWNLPLAFDGIHLSEEGHARFAQEMIREIVFRQK